MTATSTEGSRAPRPKKARIFPALLVLLGLVMAGGGGWLASLGGSLYYLVTGLAVTLSGILIWRGNANGGWLYALVLAWTLVWSLIEVGGIDFWTLLPRLALLFGLGLWLVTPWYRRTVHRGAISESMGMTTLTVFLIAFIFLISAAVIQGDLHETRNGSGLPHALQSYKPSAPEGEWHHYGNHPGGLRYSELTQLTPENVAGLEVAWTYRTGDFPPPEGPNRRFEVTPLKIGDTLYFCTPRNDIVALDAESGVERWRYRAGVDLSGVTGSAACRGVAYYQLPVEAAEPADGKDGKDGKAAAATGAATTTGAAAPTAATASPATASSSTGDAAPADVTASAPVCQQRIYGATVDARLIAVDALTGERCADFGDAGQVDLKKGMGEIIPGYYYVSSVPQLVRGKVVVGGWVSDGQKTGEPAGVIRAFDARSGAFAWAFDPGRPDFHGEPAEGEHYTRGTPNGWAPMSADEDLGMVYVPTGNATPDYYGGHRSDLDNALSSSILALNAETGEKVWHFQTTHYDLWDYDLGSQPSLVELDLDGTRVPALIQPTKRGQNFVLDRRTGEPVYAVAEMPVPLGGVEDPARLSPTQPFSIDMPSFDGMDPDEPLGIGEKDMWGTTLLDQLWCRIQFRQARWEGPMTPAGTDTVFFFPGSLGGSNWSSASFDPERRVMVGNWNRVPMLLQLIDRARADQLGLKAADGSPGTSVGGNVPQEGVPYAAVLKPFLSPLGVPCLAPPYGLVTAIDLNNRRVLWERRSGTAEDSGVLGIRSRLPIAMGVPGLGGTITTRSGLVFVAASGEQSLRALDLRTGDILWKRRLPAGGNATPMTYLSRPSGRQFVVIAAGGHNLMQTTPGDYLVGYALPKP